MTDKQQENAGKVVKVGIKQLKKPTPNFIRYTFDIALLIGGLWFFLAPVITNVPQSVLTEISRWVGISGPIIKYLIKFFGWDYKERKH